MKKNEFLLIIIVKFLGIRMLGSLFNNHVESKSFPNLQKAFSTGANSSKAEIVSTVALGIISSPLRILQDLVFYMTQLAAKLTNRNIKAQSKVQTFMLENSSIIIKLAIVSTALFVAIKFSNHNFSAEKGSLADSIPADWKVANPGSNRSQTFC